MNTKTLQFVKNHSAALSRQIENDILSNLHREEQSSWWLNNTERYLENDLSEGEALAYWNGEVDAHNALIEEIGEENERLEFELAKARDLENPEIPEEWDPTLRFGWVAVW